MRLRPEDWHVLTTTTPSELDLLSRYPVADHHQRGESYGMAFADVYRGGADNAGIFQCGRDHGMVGGYFS